MADKRRWWRDPWIWLPACLAGVPVAVIMSLIGMAVAALRCCAPVSGPHPAVYALMIALGLAAGALAAVAGGLVGWLLKRLFRR
jgi:hypothetical protein